MVSDNNLDACFLGKAVRKFSRCLFFQARHPVSPVVFWVPVLVFQVRLAENIQDSWKASCIPEDLPDASFSVECLRLEGFS